MFAPGTGTPVPGGVSSWETLELLRKARIGLTIKGFDLVEVAPNYDPSEITQLLGARIIHEFIAIIACQKAGIVNY
jgi:agmatinase